MEQWTKFHLICGCVLDGCEDSDPGLKWGAGKRNAALWCVRHKDWKLLVAMVTPSQALEDSLRELCVLERELR